jgi:hypothetical protein
MVGIFSLIFFISTIKATAFKKAISFDVNRKYSHLFFQIKSDRPIKSAADV